MFPLGCGSGRLAVSLERLGTHDSTGRALFRSVLFTLCDDDEMVNGFPPDAIFDTLGVFFLLALYWFNYELVKSQLCEKNRVPQASFTISFTAGAISGAVSVLGGTIHIKHLLVLKTAKWSSEGLNVFISSLTPIHCC